MYDKSDLEKFYELCHMIEKNFPDFIKGEYLVDVDGSRLQVYSRDDEEIYIIDDGDFECITARSDVDLTDFVAKLDT